LQIFVAAFFQLGELRADHEVLHHHLRVVAVG
jgi:hypothetical protein